MPSGRCLRRHVQPERVHPPGRVTGNGDGGTDGDGQYICIGYPVGLLQGTV